jgi:hypothetical protein
LAGSIPCGILESFAARRNPMPAAERLHTREELARLGAEVFDRRVKPTLRPEDDGKFVAIDVNSGHFEVDADDYAAVARIHAAHDTDDVWLMRVGQKTAYRMG